MGWQKISPWISSTNVDDVVTSCEAACSTNSKYDYCTAPRNLKDVEGNKIETSCSVFSNVDEFSKYGVASCELECNTPCEEIKIGEDSGIIAPEGTVGTYDLTSIANDLVEGQVCIIE